MPGGEHDAGLAGVAALAAELVRLQHVAGVAVALVPRAGHAPTQLRARAPRVARVQLRAVPPVRVQVVAGGAAAARHGREVLREWTNQRPLFMAWTNERPVLPAAVSVWGVVAPVLAGGQARDPALPLRAQQALVRAVLAEISRIFSCAL